MKQTIYLRVGKHVRGGKPKVAAGTKPSDRQLADSAATRCRRSRSPWT
jgi:hypothetical protein